MEATLGNEHDFQSMNAVLTTRHVHAPVTKKWRVTQCRCIILHVERAAVAWSVDEEERESTPMTSLSIVHRINVFAA